MQVIGFAGMTFGMFLLMIAVRLSNSPAGGHVSLVFAGFILFNLFMNAGPNSTTFTLAPILFRHICGVPPAVSLRVSLKSERLSVFSSYQS
jgi:hypothetical protein